MGVFNLYNRLVNLFFSKPKFYKILTGPGKGIYIYMSGRFGFRKILGIYEKQEAVFIKNNVNKGEYCLDIGSYVGSTSLLLAKLVGESGRVYSIEPFADGCGFQKKSALKNGYKNIEIYNIALGDRVGKKKAYVFEDSEMINFEDSGFVNYKGKERSSIDLTTLDKIVSEEKIKKVDFIKIDVEGYELKVVIGGKGVIKKYKPKILIEIHNRDNYLSLYDLLKSIGYNFTDLDGNAVNKSSIFASEVFHVYAHV